jgi:hypothetical protein
MLYYISKEINKMIINENTPSREWLSTRILHSTGGIRVINDCNNIAQVSPYKDNNVIEYKIENYNSLYTETSKIGLPILGVDFYSNSYEYDSISSPPWRLNISYNNKRWFIWESFQKWAKLANAGFKNKDGLFLDLSKRIKHQLRVCEWRIREISECYNKTLYSIIKSNDYKYDDRFQNYFTEIAYLSIQSFLVDACVLRDYIAEFVSIYYYNKKGLKITTMGELYKQILKKIEEKDELTQHLHDITDENGWLKNLGTYRNVIIHKAPLAIVDNSLFSICKKFILKNIGDVPSVICPIPTNIEEIDKKRNNRYFEDFDEITKVSILGRDDNNYIDGLDYCFKTFKSLALLLDTISTKAPYKPEPIVINSSEIIIKT